MRSCCFYNVDKPIFKLANLVLFAGFVVYRTEAKGGLRLQSFSFPSKVVEGNLVTVTCTTVSGATNVNFRWYKDGKEIAKTSKVKVIQHSLLTTLVVGPVTRDDSGNYTCVGNIGKSVDSQSDRLTVLAPPEWVEEPKDVRLRKGSNATIPCEAVGNPVPSVTWKLLNRNS